MVATLTPSIGKSSRFEPSSLGSDTPLAFAGGDTNLVRYVGNAPTNATDPTGTVIVITGKDNASTFIAELKALGAKNLHVTTVVDDKGTERTYILIDPRDRSAVFKYARKHFAEVFVKKPGRKPPRKDASAMNRFVIAAGCTGQGYYMLSTADGQKPDTESIPKETVAGIGKLDSVPIPTLIIDIGGEGKHGDAININVVAIGTVPPTRYCQMLWTGRRANSSF